MGRCKVDLLGIYELVSRPCAEVVDIIHEERVGGLMVGEEDYLGAGFGKIVGCRGANSSRAALCFRLADALEDTE